ncbi:MAG: YihY/virulence factor BrkB family protein [Pirellulaceae bacterium]
MHEYSTAMDAGDHSQDAQPRRVHPLSFVGLARLLRTYTGEVAISMQLAIRRWQLDDGSFMSAGVAYYLALSIFPLLLLLSSGVGMFLKFTNLGHDAELKIFEIVAEHCSPTLEVQIKNLLTAFEDQSMVGGPFGILTAGAAAIGVFFQFERAFDKIWRIPRVKNPSVLGLVGRVVGKRLVAFVMLTGVGASIITIMVANVALSAAREWMESLHIAGTLFVFVVDTLATLCLNSVAFSVLYKFLPKRKVLWRDAFRTAVLVSVVWEIGREFLCSFLIGTHYTTTYGVIGSFIAVLLWVYWGVTLLLFGAEYLHVISLRSRKPLSMFQTSEGTQDGVAEQRERRAKTGIATAGTTEDDEPPNVIVMVPRRSRTQGTRRAA